MRIFSSNGDFNGYNIYSLKKYVDKKRILFTILVMLLAILTLIFAILYTIDTIRTVQLSKKYTKQILEYSEQRRLEQEELIRQEEERKSRIPNLTEEGIEKFNNIYSSETKRAFLTFDDGPSKNTAPILDILKENNIKAVFFVLGRQVEYFPETTKRIFDEGHYLANHGYSHQYSVIYQAPENVLEEYNVTNELVANAIGIPEYNSHLFRFPGGSVGRTICKNKKSGNGSFRRK